MHFLLVHLDLCFTVPNKVCELDLSGVRAFGRVVLISVSDAVDVHSESDGFLKNLEIRVCFMVVWSSVLEPDGQLLGGVWGSRVELPCLSWQSALTRMSLMLGGLLCASIGFFWKIGRVE